MCVCVCVCQRVWGVMVYLCLCYLSRCINLPHLFPLFSCLLARVGCSAGRGAGEYIYLFVTLYTLIEPVLRLLLILFFVSVCVFEREGWWLVE